MAYKFLKTGLLLPDDSLSRLLCCIYAHLLALLLIYIFWTWLFQLSDIWKKKMIKRSWLAAFIALAVTGVIIIAVVYPSTIVNATDTTWNYVYAREWLPMYWHGFFTNVVHCACMIVFPHPIAMSLIPFLFGISEVCYFTYIALVKFSSQNKIVNIVLLGGLILMPETFRILSYAGRNYMFALLSVGYIGSFMTDYISENDLSVFKFIRLSCMAVLLGTWRSEGIFYLLFFPVLLYFTYFYRKKKITKAVLIKAVAFVAVCYLVLWLPGKYGSEKYQGYDYAIVNTPEPLSVIFADENANLSYSGAGDDLNCIYSVIPQEYFEKYGAFSQFYYNLDNLRTPRQSGITGEKGKEYVGAAYRILLHNWKIYIKKQLNNYNESIGLNCFFALPESAKEDWTVNASEEAYSYFKWIWAYFDVGKEDISFNYDIVIVNKKVDAFLNNAVTALLANIYKAGWRISGFVKTAVLILMLISVVLAFGKREWVFFFIGILILGILFAVILTAPTMRENYYYSSYFNSYWYLLFGLSYVMNCKNGGRKRLENFK